ncbi:hypothetical protein GCM10009847_21440 [Leucobacter tardus]|uniref:CDGSH iron-sulfur domain-containing protein n=1 Tax=Leucobacter tardus TaxID=501483 RepID=A0A939TRS6_9MICO|nr:CDGSH iron-sulfur domain-containing protein [Leucobacter tardus]MBO2990342.1 CDGSH iron-sulfur domain-containing protein [Leucobacter tardus]
MRNDDAPATITAYPNGPLIVRGRVRFVDEHGASVEQPRATAALCRCGMSAIKPWCDGTHKLSGFTTETPDREPAGSDEAHDECGGCEADSPDA